MVIQLLINGFIKGCLYSLVGLGFGLIYNTTRIFHFAHGAIYTASAYLLYIFAVKAHLHFGLSIALALALTSFLGILVEAGIYHPFNRHGSSPLVIMIVSLALYTILVNLVALIFGNEVKILNPGVQKTYLVGSTVIGQIQLIQLLAFLILFSGLLLLLRKTSLGRIIRALRDNPDLVVALGVNVKKVRLTVFALGSSLAGAAAILFGLDVGIDPHAGLPALLAGVVGVIVGGTGIFEGAAFGGVILGVLQSLVIWQASARWQELLIFGILVLFLLFRPEGLLGERKRLEEI